MDATLLKSILRRFKIADYPYIIENWKSLSKEFSDVNLKHVKKADFVDMVMKKFKHKSNPALAIAELDILYLQKYSNRKLWKVLTVDVIPEGDSNNLSTVAEFENRLRKEVRSYLNAQVRCIEHQNTYWIRIAVKDAKNDWALPSVVYITHVPNTNYLMVTGLKATHKDYVLQSLVTVLNGYRVVDSHLSGRCLVSLMRLVLNKHSQGASLSFGGSPRPVIEETLPENVYNENHIEKRNRDNFVAENYGPAKLPRLEKIVYKLDTTFKGSSHVPGMAGSDRPFHCQVKFEGPSVLEGLRSLTAAGLAALPMKEHLAQVHKMAKNEFYLKQKSK